MYQVVVEKDVEIVSRFCRALVHLFRGDLSVISNELTYLEALVPGEELVISKKRCSVMAQLLADISLLASQGRREMVSLEKLCRVFGQLENEQSSLWAQPVRCDVVAMARAADVLRQVLGNCSVRVGSCGRGEGVGVFVELVFAKTVAPRDEDSSFSEYVSQHLGDRAVILSALVDLLFRRNECLLTCVPAAAGCALRIIFPDFIGSVSQGVVFQEVGNG